MVTAVDGASVRARARGHAAPWPSAGAAKAPVVAREPLAIAEILAGERARIERDIGRARAALVSVERLIRAGELLPYDVAVCEEPAWRLAVVEETAPRERHVAAGFALVARLQHAFAANGWGLDGPVMCLLPDPPDDDSMLLQKGRPSRAWVARPGAARCSISPRARSPS